MNRSERGERGEGGVKGRIICVGCAAVAHNKPRSRKAEQTVLKPQQEADAQDNTALFIQTAARALKKKTFSLSVHKIRFLKLDKPHSSRDDDYV